MKKTIVKVSLLSMMLGLMPVAMTSCKDYDDDITEINGTTGELSSQIAALQAAIEANKQAAQSAHDAAEAAMKAAEEALLRGEQAEADAQKAMAMAKAAEEAAANAKAEALAEITKQCQALQAQIDSNSSSIKENKDAIAALLGRIEGIEKGLSVIDVDGINNSIKELNTALEAVQVQLKALENYQTRLQELESNYSGLKTDVQTAISNIQAIRNDLTTLQTEVRGMLQDVDANKAAIGEIRAKLANISQEISTAVANGVNTVAGVISARLTSVTLMPDLYVGGIPTIEFKSAQYTAQQFKNGAWQQTGGQYIVSNNETEIEYRLNPGTVRTEDINAGQMAFVSRIATTRAADVDNDIISVISGEVGANGVLTVKAGKSNTSSLNLSGNKIYTVSLKVPIAKQHLFDNEASANVYSEYTRLSETYFTPYLHKTGAVSSSIPVHFNDSVSIYQSQMNQLVAAKVQYNKTLDLNTLVQGCEFVSPNTHDLVSLEDFAKYGFEVSYNIAKGAYTTGSTDHANQQEFAQISGSTFTPGAPTNDGFAAANQAAIGKQPIVHVWLKDTKNNKVVDQRYFKILITREDPTPIPPFTITPVKSADLGCSNYSFSVTWDEMTKQVLSQFPGSGISKEDFYARYGAHASVITVTKDGVNAPSLVAKVTDNVTLDNTGASVPVMTFTLDNQEVGKLDPGKSATYVVTLVYKDAKELNPDVTISFTCVITNNIATPKLGKTDAAKWVNETMLLYPIPYGSANAKAKAEYKTNILEGRFSPLLTGLLTCAEWDLKFATTYTGATMNFPAGYAGWKTPSQANSLDSVYVSINHATGVRLVENETVMKLDWLTNQNGISLNSMVFANSYLKIVKPLKDPSIDNTVVLNDQSFAQTVSLGDKFKLYDAFNNEVANTTGMPKNLWDYYGVQTVTFGPSNDIKVTDDMNGKNPRSLAQLHMSADINVATQILTYTNEGAPLQNDCYLQIPVTITHYWGTLTGKLYIKIKHVL